MLLVSGKGRFNRSLALSSVVGTIGRAGLKKEVGLLRLWATWPEGASTPNGTVMCGVPGARSTRYGDTGVILISLIFITQHRTHKFGDIRDHTKNLFFRLRKTFDLLQRCITKFYFSAFF